MSWASGPVGKRAGGHSSALLPSWSVVLVLALWPTGPLAGQLRVHAQAIPLVTQVSHAPGDVSRTEFAIVQPVVMLEWSHRSAPHPARGTTLFARATLDFEGATIPDGELVPGDYGEGYYDRRHPHTYVHELVAGLKFCAPWAVGCGMSATLAGGPKGFVAFGTDDPMSRPVERYPVNHHLAQILERAVLVGVAEYGPVRLEATWFNGDEPTKPSDWPNWDRGLDSRAVRATVTPIAGLEAQYSWARVKSPEHRQGAGSTQRKRSASVRYGGALSHRPAYALLEWARTEEAGSFFVFHSVLAEGAMAFGRHRPYARFERTERPEDIRTLDPFRSIRPHLDDAILGITRWTTWTAGYGVSFLTARGRFEVRPFVEGTVARVKRVRGIYDPETAYGSDVLPSLTLGVRMDWGGMSGMRMGRYVGGDDHSEPEDHSQMEHP